MKIEHVAVWTHRLEALREFYTRWFGARSNQKYVSDKGERGLFESYFLSFDGGARLELMTLPVIPEGDNRAGFESTGINHIALSVATNEELDALFERLKTDGVPVVGAPRTTGDGYYECCVLDPDGNRVELVVGK